MPPEGNISARRGLDDVLDDTLPDTNRLYLQTNDILWWKKRTRIYGAQRDVRLEELRRNIWMDWTTLDDGEFEDCSRSRWALRISPKKHPIQHEK